MSGKGRSAAIRRTGPHRLAIVLLGAAPCTSAVPASTGNSQATTANAQAATPLGPAAPAVDKATKTGTMPPAAPATAAPPKLIADTTLLLRPIGKPQARTADTACVTLAKAAGRGGWCGRVAFDIQGLARDTPATLQLAITAPVRISGGSQSVSDAMSTHLESSCAATKSVDAISIVPTPETAPCRVIATTFVPEPGEYRATVRVRDVAGTFDQSSTLTVRARSGALVALFWLALGGLIGGVLAFLRTLFRTRTADVAAALREAQRYDVAASLALRSRLVPAGSKTLLDAEVAAFLASTKAGRSNEPPAGQPKLADRISALSTWARTAQDARALEAEALKPIEPDFHRALSEVLGGAAPAARLAALDNKVQTALDLQANRGVGFEAAASIAQAAGGAVPVPDLSTFALRGVTSLEQLERRTLLAGLAETVLTFLLFAFGALLIIWIDNEAWGTTRDVLNAILVGAGAFLGAAGIRGLKDEARS